MRSKNDGVHWGAIWLTMQRKTYVLHLMLISLLFLEPLVANASSDKGEISLGYFTASRDTKIRLDSETLGKGTTIDFEKDLGMQNSTDAVRLDGYYRFSPKNRIDFSYFDLSRDSKTRINEEIQFGDEVFEIDSEIKAKLNLGVLKLAYTWSFLLRDSDFLGLSLGLYTSQTQVSLEATNAGKKDSEKLNAPLPMIGLRGRYDFAPRWTVKGSAELFGLKVDTVSGYWSDLIASVEYNAYKGIRIGGGYNMLNLNADYTAGDVTFTLNNKYQGPLLYVSVGFGRVE